MQDEEQIGESSNIIPGEFLGWVSITTDDFNLSDEDVCDLLDVSHIDQEFARTLLDICLDAEHMNNFEHETTGSFVVDDIWISGRVSRSYLNSVGNKDVIKTVKNYNSDIDIID
jgi:hypothetical protein